MGGAVIENQMQDFDAVTKRTLKEGLQEGFKVDKLLTRARLGEGLPTGDHEGTEELQGSHPLIAVGDLDHLAGGRGFGGGDPLAGLDGGFLIRTDDEFAVRLQGRCLCVEVQHRRGFSPQTADQSSAARSDSATV